MMKFFLKGPITKVAALLFTGSFVVLAAAMRRDINVYDEGLILVHATRVAQGAVLHRDFYANYGPAQFYILAGLFKLFGPSVLVERVWDTIVRAMIVAIAFLIVQRAMSRHEGFFAAGLVLIWMCFLGYYAYPVFPALLFALLGALCLLPLFEDRRSQPLLFCSGLCIGASVLFRYDVGFYTFAALTLVSAGHVLWRPLLLGTRLADLLRVLLPVYLGLALLCVPVAAAYAASGMLQDFLFDVLYFQAQFYARMRTLPFPDLGMLREAPILIGIYLPPFVWVAALFAAISCRRPLSVPETTAARPWIMLLLGSLSALFYLKGLVRVALIQMGLSIVPALMLSAMLLPCLRQSAGHRIVRPGLIAAWSGLIIVALPTLVAGVLDGRAVVQSAIWAMQPSTWSVAAADTPTSLASCRPVAGLERLACFEIDQTRADAIRYVEARTRPNEVIFVGLGRHDRILGNDALFYFVGGWVPATKWYHFDPGLQTSKQIQTAMIGDLQATKPRYAVLVSEWNDFSEPNESAVSSNVTLLDDFLRANFQPVQVFGKLTVLRATETQMSEKGPG